MSKTKTATPKWITSFEEACEKKGYDPLTILPDVSMYPEQDRQALLSTAIMFIVNDVLNEGKKFDWDNYDEYKWHLWIDMNSPGFRLGAVGYAGASANVGSRFCYISKPVAEHAFKYFEEHIRNIWVK